MQEGLKVLKRAPSEVHFTVVHTRLAQAEDGHTLSHFNYAIAMPWYTVHCRQIDKKLKCISMCSQDYTVSSLWCLCPSRNITPKCDERSSMSNQIATKDSYSPDVKSSPAKGPAIVGPTPGPRPVLEPLCPFHSRVVAVSRVHRPPEEAFHSCLEARNTLVAAPREKEKATKEGPAARRSAGSSLPGAAFSDDDDGP
ncbi:hypothetical protein G5I_14310 [Acromyrmex echinatior]|uniref:Uncharacterized protein n=1 Tax=Acromyrmex echinatior TaxID=103372 RepID=F4X720_ACREC|nr:hypothetical protein G5I_14310 [Acromyrmex echinatior]